MTVTLGSTTTALRHRVRLVHGTTGAPIAPIALGPVTLALGWAARVVGPDVIITASTTDAAPPTDPAPAAVDVIVTDGTLADHLALPPAAADQPPNSVRVTLGAPDVQVSVDPVPMTLTIVLSAQGATTASSGKTVVVRGTSGTTIALPETATPGTYRSTARTWTADHHPGDLRVNGQSVRKVAVDVTHADTRIHVVDPT
jgi:hypothetical protein